MQSFPVVLRRLLDERGLSAYTAAPLLGTGAAQLNRYMHPRCPVYPSIPVLARIVDGLQLDANQIALLVRSTRPNNGVSL